MAICKYNAFILMIALPPVLAQEGAASTLEDGLTHADLPVTETTGPSEVLQPASQKLRYRIGIAIQRYYLPSIVIIGLIGNGLSLRVMMLPHNRRLSCSLYLTFLAIVDNIFLCSSAYFWCVTDGPYISHYFSKWECKISGIIYLTSQCIGEYMVLAMTADRFVATKYPLKARQWSSRPRTKCVIAAVVIFASAINAPHFYTLDAIGVQKFCQVSNPANFFSIVYAYVMIVVGSLGPFTAIVAMNTTIIYTVMTANKARLGNTGCGSLHGIKKEKDQKLQEKQMTVLLLLVSFALLVLTLPGWLMNLYYAIVPPPTDPDNVATYVIVYHFCNKLFISNSAINFFLYCLGGSKFRQDVARVCCCCSWDTDVPLSRSVSGSLATVTSTVDSPQESGDSRV